MSLRTDRRELLTRAPRAKSAFVVSNSLRGIIDVCCHTVDDGTLTAAPSNPLKRPKARPSPWRTEGHDLSPWRRSRNSK
jgi:hypothetical protein